MFGRWRREGTIRYGRCRESTSSFSVRSKMKWTETHDRFLEKGCLLRDAWF